MRGHLPSQRERGRDAARLRSPRALPGAGHTFSPSGSGEASGAAGLNQNQPGSSSSEDEDPGVLS